MFDGCVKYFINKKADLEHLIKFIVIMLLCKFLYVMLLKQYKMYEGILALKSVLSLYCLIFEKLTKLACASDSKRSSQAQIINYILIDSAKLGKTIKQISGIVIYPVQIITYSYLIFLFLGGSFIFGLLVIVGMIYLNNLLFKKLPTLQQAYMKKKDERIKISSETLNELKLLKMYAWENIFENKVNRNII